ncbi:MAG TPA: NAD(P)-dependent oxidoreductase [Bacillota bacterium]|nr:NAD(P)-dependent oxidoreductase [Bacillota bacterium]HPT87155.1 NAD(P)-dependent oxidoreductase [Bacillota bacterium]
MNEKVGFIGLGAMGKPMALNILKSGTPLITMVHRNKNVAAEISAAGGELVSSPAAIGEQASYIFICVPTAADVEGLLFGENGLVHCKKQPIVIDCSTHDIASVRSFYQRLKDYGIAYLDAPISGGPKGAEEASLGMMIGGDREIFERVLPILQKVAAHITYVGESGLGQAAKLANNLIISAELVAISEAFALAVKAGVNPSTLYQVLKTATADSRMLNAKAPAIINENYNPGFRLALNHKDLGLIMKTARDLNVPLLVTALVDQIFGQAKTDYADLDNSSVALFYQKLAGVSFKDPNKA